MASRAIKKGEKLSQQDIIFKRSDDGLSPDESKFIIGRTASEDIKEESPITWAKLL